MHQVCKVARGVVVVNVQDALPFSQLNEPVSSEGIALLILDYQDERIPAAKQLVKFPAHSSDADEPILITAAMLQIGSQPIQRHRPDTCVKIGEVETQVVRMLVYRDQVKIDWASFMQGPVRAAVSLEAMSVVPQDSILDIWDQQYVDKFFRKTAPKDVFMFAATLRLQGDAAQRLLDLSGQQGLFVY